MPADLKLPPGPKTKILGLDFAEQMKADPLKTAMQLKAEYLLEHTACKD